VQIRPTHPNAAGGLDQALVEVSITGQTVHDVLAVPVTALLAGSGGGYAVEVVGGDGAHRLVRVTPGLFDDAAGMVQVSGSGLAAGQRVVVPGNE
jgi:multidrug efflux pump subunit AcrA (membrane-fusion protein)